MPQGEGWREGSIAATQPLESNDSPRESMGSVRAVAPPTTGSLSLGRGLGWGDENLALLGFGVHPVSIDEAVKCSARVSRPRRPSDRRSPALITGPGFKGICALRARFEGRRPSVGRSGGVRRPAPNKGFLEAQQELRMTKDSQEPVKSDFSSARPGPLPGGEGARLYSGSSHCRANAKS
jgi:hypothetical protein